ncbi:PAS domain-containing protein [Rhodobacteraceae bacterium 2CG4]|uniref:PAS domain-containing protein n=1 Tax=Halovulum marinum TaxID=2662447 RepID=A0A6L5Z0W4_9RHOB|nr:PAS domain-containing protein [Halovulum marinum]MSU90203.1 PAS domain-containing protein [Halovulum marinum]
MNTDALTKLRAYWEDLRADRIAPYRSELDPRRFEDVLEHMFILEQLGPDQIRVRLGGLALCEMMGMEVRGMPPEALIDSPHREAFRSHITAVLSAPAVLELDLLAADAQGRPMRGQMLLLPLRSDFGEVTRILGCAVTERIPVRTPVNFGIEAHRITVVHGFAGDGEAPGALPGFAEPAAGFSGAPSLREVIDNPAPMVSRPRRGHLKVVPER